MKLLFDQNLSHKLVDTAGDLFPESTHVRNVGLNRGEDEIVWRFATNSGHMIVSKDDDFHQLSFLRGAPPKVIWVRLGNCSTAAVADCLRTNIERIRVFGADPEAAFLILP